MLTNLHIQNIVLINNLSLKFETGLIVFTGETGAGKSILLEGLGLALGSRANFDLIGKVKNEAKVTAEFEININHPVTDILKNQGIEYDKNLILKRIISKDGKSRALINGSPVNAQVLKTIGLLLVEVQGQFDNHALLNSKNHRYFLDQFGDYEFILSDTKLSFNKMKKSETNLLNYQQEINNEKEMLLEMTELLSFFEKINPKINEVEFLIKERSLISNSSKFSETLNSSMKNLDGELSARKLIFETITALEKANKINEGALEPAINALNKASNELEETINIISNLHQMIDSDPNRLDEIDERLYEIRTLARKIKEDPNLLYEYNIKLKNNIHQLENNENLLKHKIEEHNIDVKAYKTKAMLLRNKRLETSKQLDELIHKELPSLKLEDAKFNTSVLELDKNFWNEYGMDEIFFKVITNPEQSFMPLGKIASGGELSRFLLAIKVVLADSNNFKSLIFDEVDSGIGGKTATAVGKRLKRLSRINQVIVITHSPQVASLGKFHFFIKKELIEQRLQTQCNNIDYNDRVEEIARMLSGEEITNEARAAAKNLLIIKYEN